MKKKILKNIAIGIKVVLTILFVYYVNKTVSLKSFNWRQLFTFKPIIIALMGSLISQALQIERWYLLINSINDSCTRIDALTTYFEGSVLGFVTPARAGELLRGYTLDKINRKDSVIAVLVERAVGVSTFFILGLLIIGAIPIINNDFDWLDLFINGVYLAGFISTLFLLFLYYISKFLKLRWSKLLTFKIISISFVNTAVIMFQTAFLFRVFINISFKNAIFTAIESYAAVQFMPVTVANMGIREFYFSYFAHIFSGSAVPMSFMLSVSLLIVIFNLILPSFPGLFMLLMYHLNGNEQRKI